MQSDRPSVRRKPTGTSPRTRFIIGCFLDILGIVAIVMTLIFPFHFFLPSWSYTETTISIEPYKAAEIDYDFFMGGVVRGVVTNTIHANSSAVLSLHVEDSGGETVLAPRSISERYTFELQPQQTGLHKLILDNVQDAEGSATVRIWQYYYNILFLSLGFAVFISGIVLIITAP